MIKKFKKISAVVLSTLMLTSPLTFAMRNEPKSKMDTVKTVLKYSAAVGLGILIAHIHHEINKGQNDNYNKSPHQEILQNSNEIRQCDYDFSYESRSEVPQQATAFLRKIENQSTITSEILYYTNRFIESMSRVLYLHIGTLEPEISNLLDDKHDIDITQMPAYKLDVTPNITTTSNLAAQIAEILRARCDYFLERATNDPDCIYKTRANEFKDALTPFLNVK